MTLRPHKRVKFTQIDSVAHTQVAGPAGWVDVDWTGILTDGTYLCYTYSAAEHGARDVGNTAAPILQGGVFSPQIFSIRGLHSEFYRNATQTTYMTVIGRFD